MESGTDHSSSDLYFTASSSSSLLFHRAGPCRQRRRWATSRRYAGTALAKVAAVVDRVTRTWLLHDSVRQGPQLRVVRVTGDSLSLTPLTALTSYCVTLVVFCFQNGPYWKDDFLWIPDCKIDDFTTLCRAIFRVPQYLQKMAAATTTVCE